MMNSGCYGNEISNILLSIKVIDKNELSEFEIKKEDINFFYRNNLSENLIVISAKFKGSPDKKEIIEKKQFDLVNKKKNHNRVKLKLAVVPLKI